MNGKPPDSMARKLVQIIVIAGLYYATAKLGFLVALPPGNVTVLWPPSGLALAAMLVLGGYSAIGVYAGSFLVNLSTMSGAAALPTALAMAAAIAAGSTLQAWVGALAIRKFVRSLPPETVNDTLLAVGVSAVCTLIAPLIGVSSLCLTGLAGWSSFFTLAWTWWLGDFIGILIFTPALVELSLSFYRRQKISEVFLWPITCFIIGLVLLAAWMFHNSEQRRIADLLQRDTTEIAQVLASTIDHHTVEPLTAVRAFYGSSQTVERAEFNSFSTPLLDSISTLTALSWSPRVTQAERPAYESALRAGGFPDFTIYALDAQGQARPEGGQPEYFPVTYIEPFEANSPAIGYDNGSSPARLQAIQQARDSGQAVITEPLRLIRANQDQAGLLIVTPIYKNGAPIDTLEQRRASFAGVVIGAVPVDDLVQAAFETITPRDLEFYLYDVTNPTSPKFLAYSPSISGPHALPASGAPALASLEGSTYQSATLNVGGHDWRIVIRPGRAYQVNESRWIPWMVLLMGALLTGGFLAYVQRRQKAERALREKEAEYRLIADNTQDLIWILDLESQRFVYGSPSVQKMLGYTPAELTGLRMQNLLVPASLKQAEQNIQASLPAFIQNQDRGARTAEFDQLCKDGSILHTEVSTTFALNAAGKVQIVGITRDITERKQAALRQETLYRIADATQTAESLQGLYPQIHRQISAVMYAENFYIALYNPAADLLEFVYAADLIDRAEIIEPLRPERGLTAYVFHTGRSLLYFDGQQEPAVEVVGRPCQAWLGVPLIVHGAVIGVMALYHYSDASVYGEREQHMLEFVSAQIAAAIDRKRAEEAVQLIEKRNRALIENAPDGITLLNAEGQFTFGSPSAFRMFGYTAEEAIGSPARQWLHPEDVAELQQRFAELLASPAGASQQAEYRFLHRDGGYRWVDCILTNLLNEPAVNAVVNNFRDVTEIKTTQLALQALNRELEQRVEERTAQVRHSEATYRALFENSNDGIFLMTPAGDEIQANQHAMDMLGYTWEEYHSLLLAGRRNPMAAPEQQVDAEERFAAVLRGEQVPLYERTFITKSGRRLEVEINLSPVRAAGGEVVMVQSVVRDITERKKAEAALAVSRDQLSAANSALEKASRLKDEFLASMSHELRTPLTSILGLSEALQLQTFGPLNEGQAKALKNIETSGRHLLDLINDILDLSKIEAGKLDMQFELCPVGDICQASLLLVKGMAGKKKLNVGFSMNAAAIFVEADPRRLKQMLVNLLSNAIKFTPDGGRLGLEVLADEAAGAVTFTVWDQGIGISPEDLGRLFKPFVQLDNSLSRQHAGTGLGLSLVQRLAELQKGSVKVESAPGKGSRFSIILPWNEGLAPPAPPEAPRAAASLQNALVIDDSELDVDRIARLLKAIGVPQVVQPGLSGALERAAATQPSAILLDLNFPEGSGLDLLKALKADARTRDIPVIIVSVEERRAEALSLGALGYLVKPVAEQDLRHELSKAAALARPAAPLMVVGSRSSAPLVMIADDNEVILDMVSEFLRSTGYRVIAVRSGMELLERAAEHHPGLLLVDIQMPGMDGMEAMRRIRANRDPQLAATPMIAVTALAMTGDREKCLEAGADDYISKPISLILLIERIKALLKQGQK